MECAPSPTLDPGSAQSIQAVSLERWSVQSRALASTAHFFPPTPSRFFALKDVQNWIWRQGKPETGACRAGEHGMTELIVGTKDRFFRSDLLGEIRGWWSHGTVSGIRHNLLGSMHSTWDALRGQIQILSTHYTHTHTHTHTEKKKKRKCEVMDMFISFNVVVISQRIHISNHQLYMLNIHTFYLLVIPQ